MTTWTERQTFEATMNMMKNGTATCIKEGAETVIPAEELLAWYENRLEKLDVRAAKERARREEKKTMGDELEQEIFEMMTEEPITCDEIVERLNNDDITVGKVRYRVSALARKGKVAKTIISVVDDENKKKNVTAYALPVPEAF